ncbi:MAG: shikimate dehydrogenase [Caldilineaceae bacterium]
MMATESTISGKTKIVGVIGWPVSHSISPQMHNAAFRKMGLDWCYIPLPVANANPATVGDAVRGLPALGLVGANVTVPHKQGVIPHLDWLTPAAEAIGAVNTIRVEEDGKLSGDNTDARGFIADLRDHGVAPTGKRAVVLGAGGSARAVVFGLAEAGCLSIAILNRTEQKAHDLAMDMRAHFPFCRLSGHDPKHLALMVREADLIVNCTSLGMTPSVETTPWDDTVAFRPDQVVYDLVYNPPQTRLLQKAITDGAQGINGLGMLIWQGAIAFERWTGQLPPVNVMRAAVEAIFTA